ncbi:unnamed protein product, partial [Musa banksii]
DNAVDNYKKVSKIFCVNSEPVCIWDLSGQTNLILMNEWNRFPQNCHQMADQEGLLEVQVYTLSENMNCKSEVKKHDPASDRSKMNGFSFGGSPVCNGSLRNVDSSLQNGNLKGVLSDLNGELVLAFGDILRSLWAPERTPVFPWVFKAKLAHFSPQFNGFNQHDLQTVLFVVSYELLAFLLDGLHEGLNHVKHKPYVEAKDASSRPDEEVADEYRGNHLARNDSIIVDICQIIGIQLMNPFKTSKDTGSVDDQDRPQTVFDSGSTDEAVKETTDGEDEFQFNR